MTMLLTFWGRTGGHLCDSNRWWTEWTDERVIINTLKQQSVCAVHLCLCVNSLVLVRSNSGMIRMVLIWIIRDETSIIYAMQIFYVDIIYMNYADTTICEFCCCVSREENIFTCWHGMPKHKTWSVRRETMLSQTDINQTPIIWCKCVWKLWLNLCSWQDPLFGRSCKTGWSLTVGCILSHWTSDGWML